MFCLPLKREREREREALLIQVFRSMQVIVLLASKLCGKVMLNVCLIAGVTPASLQADIHWDFTAPCGLTIQAGPTLASKSPLLMPQHAD